jgi:NAD-dependent deacetylase
MKIVVFTGAGISRESGLKTFRDSKDGLWEGYDVNEVASIQGWWADPQKVLDFYNMRRREVRSAEPNAAHFAIAELDKDHEVVVITQNIDDLHERAGSREVIHLHGEVLKARTVEDDINAIDWLDDLNVGHMDPETGLQLRPFVVWFGEGLPLFDAAIAKAISPDVDVLIVVGTTLNVTPASFIATQTKAKRIYVVDPTPPTMPRKGVRYVTEPATIGVRAVVDEITASTA